MRVSLAFYSVVVFLGFVTLIANSGLQAETTQGLIPTRLRCDYRVAPLGIDSPNPRLDWILSPSDPSVRGVTQSAYQILVASSSDLLAKDQGDLWDSGKVPSDQMNQIAYAGKALASAQEVWWKVRVWDQEGKPSAWSEPTQWTMAS